MAVVIPLKAELVMGLTKSTSLDEVINTNEFTLTDVTTKHPSDTTTPLTKVEKPFNTVNK